MENLVAIAHDQSNKHFCKVSVLFPIWLNSEEMTFFSFFFCGNLAFVLPWQQIKLRVLDKNNMFGRGILKEQFCKTLVKISAVR